MPRFLRTRCQVLLVIFTFCVGCLVRPCIGNKSDQYAQRPEVVRMVLAGRPLGSFPTPTGALVFVKQSTGTEAAPYAAVAETIHNKLVRSKLNTHELKLTREWTSRYSIEDQLRPDSFGVEGTIKTPWKKQS